MGRHRMISDNYWTDPKLSHYTTENLLTNLLFLTNCYSNVIGVYRVQWRSLGAGIGWTEAQMVSAARDLEGKGGVAIDEATGWVWVKNWWDHNSLSGAFKGKVGPKARSELKLVPEKWRDAVSAWLVSCDVDGVFEGSGSPIDGASMGYPGTTKGAGGNPTHIFTPITTTIGRLGGDDPLDIDALVNAAVWATKKTTTIKNEAAFRLTVRARIADQGANEADLQTLDAWRAAQETARRNEQALMAACNSGVGPEEIEQARERARVEAAFNGLSPNTQTQVVEAFGNYLSEESLTTYSIFRKSGLSSKLVQIELAEFLRSGRLTGVIDLGQEPGVGEVRHAETQE